MKSVLIIADIEGSTGCLKKSDSQLFNDGWVKACIELTKDLNAIVAALFSTGKISRIKVKDFHRTGFNIFPELLDKRVELSQGYEVGPVPGIGACSEFDLLFMVGMHAAAGTAGFIAHTLTSKFSSLKINGEPLSEAELFAASVAKFGLVPVFFSGCNVSCQQVKRIFPEIATVLVDKPPKESCKKIREMLADTSLQAANLASTNIFSPTGPFKVEIEMRDGQKAANKIAQLWQLDITGHKITFSCPSLEEVYVKLIEIAYLKPLFARHLEGSLKLFNLWGRLTHLWARNRAKKMLKSHQLS